MKCKTIFANCWTYVSAFLGISGSVLAVIVIPGNITIAYRWLILCTVVLGVLYVILLVGIHNLKKIVIGSYNMNIAECHWEQDENTIYLFLEPYVGINYDQYVSIYWMKEKRRSLIGIGIVDNISDDNGSSGFITVRVQSVVPKSEDIWKRIKANEIKALRSVKLTSSIIKTQANVEVL